MNIISKLKEIFKKDSKSINLKIKPNQNRIQEEPIKINIKELAQLEPNYLLDTISNIPKDKRILILKNDIIKNKLKDYILEECKEDTEYYISQVKTKITSLEIISLFDVSSIKNTYNNDEFEEYKLFKYLCSTPKEINEIINYLLSNKEMFFEYMKHIYLFHEIIKYIDLTTNLNIINKLYEYKAKELLYYYINYIPINEQIKIIDKKIDENILIKIVKYLNPETISYLFKTDTRMEHIFYKLNTNKLINENIIYPQNILNNPKFFNLLKDESFIVFRNNINLIEKYNLPEPIERNLKKYYKELFDEYNPDTNLFKEYEEIILNPTKREKIFRNRTFIVDRNTESIYKNYQKNNKINLTEKYQQLTNNKLSEIVVDALFEDNIYNVFLNIKEMLRYNNKLPIKEQILDNNKLDFYNLILKIDTIPNIDKIRLYNNLKEKNINLMFYEDLRKLKDKSYKMINDSLFKIEQQIPNKELSKKYKVPIYDMRNNEFFMLVRSEDTHQKTTETKRNCYSIISNDNSITFGAGTMTIYGYNLLDIEKVLHIYEKDAFSTDIDEKPIGQKYAVNRIMTLEEIVKGSSWYSEIQIKNIKDLSNNEQYIAKNPDYIVAYNEPTYYDLAESRRLNLPIVIISETRLEKDKQIKIDTNVDEEDAIYVYNRGEEATAEYKLRK